MGNFETISWDILAVCSELLRAVEEGTFDVQQTKKAYNTAL